MNKPFAPIEDVVTIARDAGAVIMAMRDAVVGNAVIKGDGSPVTEADKKSSDIVIKGLQKLTPHIPVISEESPDEENRAIQQQSDTYWIVDPLDGTRSYIDGHDGFGVHIGLIDKGQPVMAAIYFPAQGILYYTDGINGAYRQEDGKPAEPIRVTAAVAEGDVPSAAVSWVARRRPSLDVCDYKPVAAVGGGRVCLTAEGATDLAIIEAPFSYWDIAAAHALLKAAGGELFDFATGKPVVYEKDRLFIPPAIGGHTDIVAEYREDFVRGIKRAQELKAKPPKP